MALINLTKILVEALGAGDVSVGAAEQYENTTPKTEKIVRKIKELIEKKKSWGY